MDLHLHHLSRPVGWWIVWPGGITRVKFMEAQGALHWPPVPICPLLYIATCPQFRLGGGNWGSQAGFSKLPQHPGIPCGNAGFLTSSSVQCRGGCAATKSLRKAQKALDEILLDLDNPGVASLWSEMLIQRALGRENEVFMQSPGSQASIGEQCLFAFSKLIL